MSSRADAAAQSSGKAPEGPGKLGAAEWRGAVKRAVREFKQDNVTDWAAALTYYGVLSIFPALIALVSVLGLVGRSATQPLIDNLAAAAPGPARDIVTNAIRELQGSQGTAGVMFVAGLLVAIWSASGYVSAFMRASNSIWDVAEGRPLWTTLPLRVGITVVMLILLAASAVAVVVTGPLAKEVGDVIGVGGAAVTAWDIAKWPVLVLLVVLMLAILYYAAPNIRQPGFKWVTPGGLLAVVLWIVASALFALYVANFSSYNKTYGALGGVAAFLVWLWITNVVILLGAELDAELERGRQIAAGQPADREPFLEPRGIPDPDSAEDGGLEQR